MLDMLLGYLISAARWLLLLALCLARPDEYTPWKGTVVEIVRPHEIRVRKADNSVVNVRIYGIQCPLPASGEPFSSEVMHYVTERLEGKVVEVQCVPGRIEGTWYKPGFRLWDRLHWEKGRARYERLIGLVYVDGRSIGEELLQNGMAWWSSRSCPLSVGTSTWKTKPDRPKLDCGVAATPCLLGNIITPLLSTRELQEKRGCTHL